MKTEPASEQWQDIAAEAAVKLVRVNSYVSLADYNAKTKAELERITPIILAAIEKAHRKWMDGEPSLLPTKAIERSHAAQP